MMAYLSENNVSQLALFDIMGNGSCLRAEVKNETTESAIVLFSLAYSGKTEN